MTTEQQILSEQSESKPLPKSWRAKIRNDKGYRFMVEDIFLVLPEVVAKDERIKKRIEDNCETLWKLGAADCCEHINHHNIINNDKKKKKIVNESILVADSKPVEMIEVNKILQPLRKENGKNKRKKTTKKACDC